MKRFSSPSALLSSYPQNISSRIKVLLRGVLCSPCNHPIYIHRAGEASVTGICERKLWLQVPSFNVSLHTK